MTIPVPPRDSQFPRDDPWDADAARYLLTKPDVAASFTRGNLMEYLRCQKDRVAPSLRRVLGVILTGSPECCTT